MHVSYDIITLCAQDLQWCVQRTQLHIDAPPTRMFSLLKFDLFHGGSAVLSRLRLVAFRRLERLIGCRNCVIR